MFGTNTEPSVVQQQRDQLEEYLGKVGTNTDSLDALPSEDDDESKY